MKIMLTIQHIQDIHKLPLHKAIDGQNICVKVYFTGWQEQFLQDDKNNQNHHDLFYFTTASIVKFKIN